MIYCSTMKQSRIWDLTMSQSCFFFFFFFICIHIDSSNRANQWLSFSETFANETRLIRRFFFLFPNERLHPVLDHKNVVHTGYAKWFMNLISIRKRKDKLFNRHIMRQVKSTKKRNLYTMMLNEYSLISNWRRSSSSKIELCKSMKNKNTHRLMKSNQSSCICYWPNVLNNTWGLTILFSFFFSLWINNDNKKKRNTKLSLLSARACHSVM